MYPELAYTSSRRPRGLNSNGITNKSIFCENTHPGDEVPDLGFFWNTSLMRVRKDGFGGDCVPCCGNAALIPGWLVDNSAPDPAAFGSDPAGLLI